MPFRKILLMQSVEDAITRNRRRKFESNPAAQGCELANCYAVELTPVQKAMRMGQMMEAVTLQPFDAKDLAERLTRQIAEFQPDLVLVHPGFVFHTFTQEMIAVLKMLKSQFPNLKFGLLNSEDPSAYLRAAEKFFDHDAELDEFIAQVSIPRRPVPPEMTICNPFFLLREWKSWKIEEWKN